MKQKKTYKLALLSGPIFSNNMGCNALTYGSLHVLSDAASQLGVKFEYYLVGNPENGVIPPELQSYEIHFMPRLPDLSFRGRLSSVYRRNYKAMKRLDEMLGGIDLFLDNAWGDSFSDIYGRDRFETILHHFDCAFRRGKPLVLLPQTIGPFQSPLVQKRAGEALRRAGAVYARDPLSVQCARDLVPELDLYETIDVALFMPFVKRQTDREGLVIGINPSGLLWRGGYTGRNQFGLKDDYPAVIRKIITDLLSQEDVSVELIGHDIKGPNAGDGDDDYYICKLLQREFPRCRVGPFFYSPVEAKSYISGLDLLIGSRMHCCIAAYSSGVPVFPLAYSRKFKGLFAEKLGYEFLTELKDENAEEVLLNLRKIIGVIDVIKRQMPGKLLAINQYKKEFLENLASTMQKVLGI